jgi:hypothetical protein
MPIQTFNVGNVEPIQTAGIGNIFAKMLETSKAMHENTKAGAEAQYAPEYYKQRTARAGHETEEAKQAALIKAAKAKYAPENEELGNLIKRAEAKNATPLEKAKLAFELARADREKAHAESYRQGGGSRGGLTAGTRLWSSLPSNVKSQIMAQGQAYGFSPEQTAMHISGGGSLEDLKEQAKQNGVDVENAEPQYAPTTSNITGIKNAEAAGAELDYLENQTAKDLSQYGSTIRGYSPAQIIDHFKGDTDKLARFLGARALQPEIAGARSRVAGGSNAQEALKEAQDAALGSFKVFGGLITPEIREKVQHYINQKLKGALKARKKGLYEGVKDEINEGEEFSKQLQNQSADPLGLGL